MEPLQLNGKVVDDTFGSADTDSSVNGECNMLKSDTSVTASVRLKSDGVAGTDDSLLIDTSDGTNDDRSPADEMSEAERSIQEEGARKERLRQRIAMSGFNIMGPPPPHMAAPVCHVSVRTDICDGTNDDGSPAVEMSEAERELQEEAARKQRALEKARRVGVKVGQGPSPAVPLRESPSVHKKADVKNIGYAVMPSSSPEFSELLKKRRKILDETADVKENHPVEEPVDSAAGERDSAVSPTEVSHHASWALPSRTHDKKEVELIADDFPLPDAGLVPNIRPSKPLPPQRQLPSKYKRYSVTANDKDELDGNNDEKSEDSKLSPDTPEVGDDGEHCGREGQAADSQEHEGTECLIKFGDEKSVAEDVKDPTECWNIDGTSGHSMNHNEDRKEGRDDLIVIAESTTMEFEVHSERQVAVGDLLDFDFPTMDTGSDKYVAVDLRQLQASKPAYTEEAPLLLLIDEQSTSVSSKVTVPEIETPSPVEETVKTLDLPSKELEIIEDVKHKEVCEVEPEPEIVFSVSAVKPDEEIGTHLIVGQSEPVRCDFTTAAVDETKAVEKKVDEDDLLKVSPVHTPSGPVEVMLVEEIRKIETELEVEMHQQSPPGMTTRPAEVTLVEDNIRVENKPKEEVCISVKIEDRPQEEEHKTTRSLAYQIPDKPKEEVCISVKIEDRPQEEEHKATRSLAYQIPDKLKEEVDISVKIEDQPQEEEDKSTRNLAYQIPDKPKEEVCITAKIDDQPPEEEHKSTRSLAYQIPDKPKEEVDISVKIEDRPQEEEDKFTRNLAYQIPDKPKEEVDISATIEDRPREEEHKSTRSLAYQLPDKPKEEVGIFVKIEDRPQEEEHKSTRSSAYQIPDKQKEEEFISVVIEDRRKEKLGRSLRIEDDAEVEVQKPVKMDDTPEEVHKTIRMEIGSEEVGMGDILFDGDVKIPDLPTTKIPDLPSTAKDPGDKLVTAEKSASPTSLGLAVDKIPDLPMSKIPDEGQKLAVSANKDDEDDDKTSSLSKPVGKYEVKVDDVKKTELRTSSNVAGSKQQDQFNASVTLKDTLKADSKLNGVKDSGLATPSTKSESKSAVIFTPTLKAVNKDAKKSLFENKDQSANTESNKPEWATKRLTKVQANPEVVVRHPSQESPQVAPWALKSLNKATRTPTPEAQKKDSDGQNVPPAWMTALKRRTSSSSPGSMSPLIPPASPNIQLMELRNGLRHVPLSPVLATENESSYNAFRFNLKDVTDSQALSSPKILSPKLLPSNAAPDVNTKPSFMEEFQRRKSAGGGRYGVRPPPKAAEPQEPEFKRKAEMLIAKHRQRSIVEA